MNSFQLSEFVADSKNCVHCLMNKCVNKSHHTDANIKKMSSYVNNPCLLDQVQKDVEECASQIRISDFHDEKILKNGFIYTTCLFCFFKKNQLQCKNMKEGRFGKCILRNGTTITYCYPELKNVKHRIQIGIHLDLMISTKGDLTHSYLGKKENTKSYASSFKEGKKVVKNKVEEKEKVEEKIMVEEKEEKEEKVEEKIMVEEGINIYKDMYEKLYKDVYESGTFLKADTFSTRKDESSKSLLLENISLKAHIQYLHMKIDTMLKGKYDTMDEEIGKSFYEKVTNHHS